MTRLEPNLKIPAISPTRSSAVVIGAGLGGLSAAMRLGSKGYSVTVIDRLDRVGGRGSSVTKNGFRFDLGPTILTVPQVFERLWKDCGKDFAGDVELVPLDPFYEIRWQDGSRFQVRSSEEEMLAEVTRNFPKDLKGYCKFLEDCEKRYVFGFEGLGRRPMNKIWDLLKEIPGFIRLRADRSVYAHVSTRVKDPKLRMALSFHPLFIGGDPRNVTSMYILVSHLEKAFGVHYVKGGVQALADAMANVVKEQGGQVLLNSNVENITLSKQKADGVMLENGLKLNADIVVSNADPGWTYNKLLPNQKKRWTEKKLKKSRWSMGLFVWYFGTKNTKKKWQDVGHHTIMNGPRYRGLLADIFDRQFLADDMSIYLHRPSVTDPSVAPKGDDCFYALSPVPNLKTSNPIDWSKELEGYKNKMRMVLEETIPGFSDAIIEEHILTPKDFEERYLSPYGSGFSLEPRIFQSAWFRPHNVSEDIENLYLVGAGTHPGAGIPSVVTSSEVLSQLVSDPVTGGT
ncbi:MAG: phytoene desaturase [Paracoccaceae bacterium]|jgi:phytoene desaturase|nr:MAG: phytoene dehydrogenase [Rhodobacteraceae bacterium MED-G07]|tara:strand:+ start:64 stop:1605 length:1542 start_codon:yes stop_codon:yes gene_type:complete